MGMNRKDFKLQKNVKGAKTGIKVKGAKTGIKALQQRRLGASLED